VSAVLLSTSWPFLLGKVKPENASMEEKLGYLKGGAILVSLILLCLFVAIAGAILLARIAREDYRNEVEENLGDLVRGAQEDIRKGKGSTE
jgi:hypothetical protein